MPVKKEDMNRNVDDKRTKEDESHSNSGWGTARNSKRPTFIQNCAKINRIKGEIGTNENMEERTVGSNKRKK